MILYIYIYINKFSLIALQKLFIQIRLLLAIDGPANQLNMGGSSQGAV